MRFVAEAGALIGFFFLLGAVFTGTAPQQAAMAAIACACAIIPYVMYRASQIFREEKRAREFRSDLLARLSDLEKAVRDNQPH